MKSPLKSCVVYDLETGGLKKEVNSVTEVAMVSVDLETLEIHEKESFLIKPYVDLTEFYNITVRAMVRNFIFKNLSAQDPETKIKTIRYNKENLKVNELENLEKDLTEFLESIKEIAAQKRCIFKLPEIMEMLKDTAHSPIIKLILNNAYNPVALDVTKLSLGKLEKEGIDLEDVPKRIKSFFERSKVGNSKPVLAGHNINNFDNDFIYKLYGSEKDFKNLINLAIVIDTIVWARLKWFDAINYTLGSCTNSVGLTLKGAHRALADTVANAKLLIKMFQHLRSDGSSSSSSKERKKFKINDNY